MSVYEITRKYTEDLILPKGTVIAPNIPFTDGKNRYLAYNITTDENDNILYIHARKLRKNVNIFDKRYERLSIGLNRSQNRIKFNITNKNFDFITKVEKRWEYMNYVFHTNDSFYPEKEHKKYKGFI